MEPPGNPGRFRQDFFGYFGRRLVDLAEISLDSSVLDVGCGTGAVLLPAAATVNDGGRVVGVDVTWEMLVEARRSLAQAGLAAEVVLGDAERLPFGDSVFDIVASSFAISYFPSTERAFGEMRRVLRPGGCVLICVSDGWWFQGDPTWRWHEELLESLDAPLGAGRFREPTELVAALEGGGLRVERVDSESFPLEWADASEWWRANWSHGYRKVLEALEGPRLEQYRTECFARLRQVPIRGRLEVLLARCR
ncbi:MAG: class I SAM-dependent methyltransferase [Acidimicrobiales bacterium]